MGETHGSGVFGVFFDVFSFGVFDYILFPGLVRMGVLVSPLEREELLLLGGMLNGFDSTNC